MGEDLAERRRPSLLSYQPRRRIPWQAADLLLIVAFHFVVAGTIVAAAIDLGLGGPSPSQAPQEIRSSTDHVVLQLLSEGGPWVAMLCIVSAAIVAPIYEEFFYRVLIQGWMEAVGRRWRRRVPALRNRNALAILPIVLSSLLFASQHFRVSAPQIDPKRLTLYLAAGLVASLLTLVFGVALLRWRVGATAADFGWDVTKLRGDIVLGLSTFAVIVVPIYGLQLVLNLLLAPAVAPDPIPLFFFAAVLGFLYFRTHRILPIIVVHAALNTTSLALAWWMRCSGN